MPAAFRRKGAMTMIELNRIYNMDCLEGMKLLDDNSIDSIVTDPPYELGFMGKKWDSTGIAYNVDVWRECLRVLKPGGHLLAFGGTRTYHRMACAIEDAGFEIRDQMQWIYGSGFPKSHNISKAIDKKFGAKREVIKTVKGMGKQNPEWNGTAKGRKENYYKPEYQLTASATPEAKQWDGWGTALKPAHEPIVLARKPISEKTIAENVLKWGTGGLNIDGCRIPTEDDLGRLNKSSATWGTYGNGPSSQYGKPVEEQGRFPANVILDEEAGKLLDEQSGILKSGALKPYQENHQNASSYKMNRYKTFAQPANEGGASRFFYCAKASKKERGEGNNHPTVKPVSLIKYLVTLVTPPDGVCLDPFIGSGTTAIACISTNCNYIGFELDKHYCEIANERIRKALAEKVVSE
jgi:site-specific DNA-methyltransferase (adenine-specific)